jgi:hypothetical protein
LTHDLFLPTLLFAALGGMTWAVRGCSGFGATAGCIFAGVMWGAAWWFIAHDPTREQSRRYVSGWIVLALTVGVGVAGARGWMQWPSFFEGRLVTNYAKGEFVPISKLYGFLWLFIAGMPWAGLGACLLAWCGSLRETRVWHWAIRIACGMAAATFARYLFDTFPEYFLPLYESLESQYQDFDANPSLKRLVGDSGLAIYHMGWYLGFLLFEVARREWKNVVLILTVGIVNGAGWALCQNWKWAPQVWPNSNFNFWRCWESSGGISIGVALGIAYFLVNRKMPDKEQATIAARRAVSGPNFEWLLVFYGLTWFLGLFLRFQMGGWGSYYFSTVILFGLAYYLLNRGTSATETPRLPRPGQVIATIEWGAVALAVALIVGLFIPGREFLQYARVYLAATMVCGIGWYLLRRKTFETEKTKNTPIDGDPNLERLGVYLGLLMGLGLSLRNGLKGWFNIYMGDEEYWSRTLWQYLGPAFLVCLIAIALWVLFWPVARNLGGRLFPHAYGLIWLVLIMQNVIGQLVTGPLSQWNEMAFSIYYVLLFAITVVITFHYHFAKDHMRREIS